MDVILLGKLVAIILLVVGNAFFVGSEVAITAARRSRIKQLADMGDDRAKVVKLLHDEPTRFYAVTQIGITLVSMALGYIGMDTFKILLSPLFETLFGMFLSVPDAGNWAAIAGLTFGFIIISFLHVVGGELAPKVLAYHKAEMLSCSLGWIINWLYIIWRPVIWVMNYSSNYLLIICGQGDIVGENNHGHDASAMTSDELCMIINASASSGAIDENQGRMLQGVFDISEEGIQSVMIPKPDVDIIPIHMTFREALHLFSLTDHHRYPVMDNDQVVGIIRLKEITHALDRNCDNLENLFKRPITDFMFSDPYMIPSSAKMGNVLKEFNINRRRMGCVVNEHGAMLGVVTPGNILDRLEGEYLNELATDQENVRKLKGSQWEINGTMRVSDLELTLNFPFPRGPGYVTVGGLIFDRLGKMPEVGDIVDLENGRLQVIDMEDMRVRKVIFQIRAKDENSNWQLADKESAPDLPNGQ